MKIQLKTSRVTAIILTTTLYFLFSICIIYGQDEVTELKDLLELEENTPEEIIPKERIFFKDDIAHCTGSSKAAAANNKAADLMKKGDFKGAIKLLEKVLSNAALFFPFRYNLGVCYIHENNLPLSFYHFKRAKAMVPEYSKTYLQTGYIFQRWKKTNKAIDEFRLALKYNKKELEAFVSIGNLYFERKQYSTAKKYYDASLKVNHRFPNALLGNAKIYFKREHYIKSIVLLKSIDITKDYDKSLHYYFAEASFKLRDYKKASEQYTELLKHRNDKFFLTHSASLIEHRLKLSKRFIFR